MKTIIEEKDENKKYRIVPLPQMTNILKDVERYLE